MGQSRTVSLFAFSHVPRLPPSFLRSISALPSLPCLWVMQLASRLFCPGLFLDVMPWKRKIRLKTEGERKRDISPRLKDLGNLNRFRHKKKMILSKKDSLSPRRYKHAQLAQTHTLKRAKKPRPFFISHTQRQEATDCITASPQLLAVRSITEPDNHLTNWFLKWSFKWIKVADMNRYALENETMQALFLRFILCNLTKLFFLSSQSRSYFLHLALWHLKFRSLVTLSVGWKHQKCRLREDM